MLNDILKNPANKIHDRIDDKKLPDNFNKVFISGLINKAVRKKKIEEEENDDDDDNVLPISP